MDEKRDDIDPTRRSKAVNGSDGQLDSSSARGVLGSLPRTRPQRPSARRTASQSKPKRAKSSNAKRETKSESKSETKSAKSGAAVRRKRAPSQAKTGAAERKAPPSLPPRPRAPRQGYEPEEEIELGRSVHPPSPVELAESVAGIFVELASASLKSGGRVLRDVLSPLRRG